MRDFFRLLGRVLAITAFLWFASPSCRAQKWERLGPEGGDVISLAAGAKGEVFLGTADGHMFASRDSGEHWELRGRVGKRMDSVVQDLIVDARVKTTLYAAVWTQDLAAGGGVYRSEDGGATWSSFGLEGEAVRALAQSASVSEILVAGTRSGVFKTSDAGKSWTRISPPGDEEIRNLDSVAIDPRDANVIYAGTYHLPWKTTDGGKNWEAISAGMIDDSDIMSVEIDRNNPERIFASACSGIYRSENGGGQWTKLQGIPYASRRTQQIVQDPLNAAVWYAGTTEGLWRTGDAGENWARVTARDVVANAIAFPAGTRMLLMGTETDGIWASTDGGKSFAEKNNGFSHRVVSGFVVDGKDRKHLLASSGELFESTDAGKSWTRTKSAPAGITALFSSGENWFARLRAGGAARFDNETKKWRKLRFAARSDENKTQKRKSQIATFRERTVTPEVLGMEVVGGRILAATADGLWSGGLRDGVLVRTAEKEFSGRIRWIAADEDGTLLVAEKDSIAKSMDAGKSWTKTRTQDNAGEVLWLRPENEGRQKWIVGGERGVFEFTWTAETSWRLLQSGLPSAASGAGWIGQNIWAIPMRAGGVYVSRDAGGNWEKMDGDEAGLVVAIIGDGNGRVYARAKTDGVLGWTDKAGNSQNRTF
jgi:photosystem II stability/assembly factor-like uncharacterized protein